MNDSERHELWRKILLAAQPEAKDFEIDRAIYIAVESELDIAQGHVILQKNRANVGTKDKPRYELRHTPYITRDGVRHRAYTVGKGEDVYWGLVFKAPESAVNPVTDKPDVCVEVTLTRQKMMGKSLVDLPQMQMVFWLSEYRRGPVAQGMPMTMLQKSAERHILQAGFNISMATRPGDDDDETLVGYEEWRREREEADLAIDDEDLDDSRAKLFDEEAPARATSRKITENIVADIRRRYRKNDTPITDETSDLLRTIFQVSRHPAFKVADAVWPDRTKGKLTEGEGEALIKALTIDGLEPDEKAFRELDKIMEEKAK